MGSGGCPVTHILEGGTFWYGSQLLGCSHGVWLIDSRSALWDRHGVFGGIHGEPKRL